MKIGHLSKNDILNLSAVLARWLLGGAFFYLGLVKAMNPVEFLKELRQYDLTQDPLLFNFLATALPWFEIFCGLLLLVGIAVRGTALILAVLLAPFTWVVADRAMALQAAQHLPYCAIVFDCGCGAGAVHICHKLAENAVLFALALWLLAGRGKQFCLHFTVFKSPAPI
jgi:uncharacterized membrane protein YphA (DoxX/SURF4 family)